MFRRYGHHQVEEGVEYDPFAFLAQQAQARGEPVADVTATPFNGTDYNQVGCRISVTIRCPQDEKSIDMAGEIAFRKALELTNAAASQLEIPPLPDFVEPGE